MDASTRIIDLTVAELEAVIAKMVKKELEAERRTEPGETEYVYGLEGLAQLLGKSAKYVSYLFKTGQMEPYKKAISRCGKQYITDKNMLMSMLQKT